MIDESKNVLTPTTRTYCKCSRPLPYCNPNCRMPRHWNLTQHHRSTRPPLLTYDLVGCFWFNVPLRQYFSLYRAVSQREGEREEKRIDESKNVQTPTTRTYCKCSRPLPYCNPNCRTPRHCNLTQHHRTTRPPPTNL